MVWKKVTEYKYIQGENRNPDKEIVLDKVDKRWDAVLFKKGDPDAEVIASSWNRKEVIQLAKKWMKKVI